MIVQAVCVSFDKKVLGVVIFSYSVSTTAFSTSVLRAHPIVSVESGETYQGRLNLL